MIYLYSFLISFGETVSEIHLDSTNLIQMKEITVSVSHGAPTESDIPGRNYHLLSEQS